MPAADRARVPPRRSRHVFTHSAGMRRTRGHIDQHEQVHRHEQITEWHYRDIVGVSTRRIPMSVSITALFREVDELFEHEIDGGEYEKYADVPYAQEFTISSVNGQRGQLNTGFGETLGADSEIAWRNSDRALTVIKTMVRGTAHLHLTGAGLPVARATGRPVTSRRSARRPG
ncbi:hypothetical protein ACGFMK_20370 [Amycolatopsis sp. NPDC049252]|uniref:hypothetical protein n=1 Tax=Amycolatopsis sp. NPDC049252 TaxID=3363933 RepID=UPI003711F75C